MTEEGVPILLDFGIAKAREASDARAPARNTERMLTPGYASPEQVRGGPVSTATDVYTLGVLLYRLLCGRGPYNVVNGLPSCLIRAILEDAPIRPSTVLTAAPAREGEGREAVNEQRRSTLARLRRRLRGDLETITLTALRKEPERRYASARALYDDIESYLSDRPISARADSFGYIAGKFIRPHRLGAALSVAVALFAVAGAVQIVIQRNRAEAQAETERRISGFLVNMLEAANPDERSHNVNAHELLDRGAKQIDAELADQPRVAARLKITMARAYSSLGLQATAGTLADTALATLSDRSESALDRADARAALAVIALEEQK